MPPAAVASACRPGKNGWPSTTPGRAGARTVRPRRRPPRRQPGLSGRRRPAGCRGSPTRGAPQPRRGSPRPRLGRRRIRASPSCSRSGAETISLAAHPGNARTDLWRTSRSDAEGAKTSADASRQYLSRPSPRAPAASRLRWPRQPRRNSTQRWRLSGSASTMVGGVFAVAAAEARR